MVVGEASIHNIMGGMESTGGVRLHNHKRKLKQRFDIIKKLGQGTYGKVQLGINKETGQEVAIKTIKKCKIETEADLIRIRREIQIMSSVQHPNIIHIYEVFENREKMVLVMEYAAGGELYDYLSERKVLAEEEARRIFRQISIAVFYCHKHKICHRDLKLENILLDQAGNAKIADFGLSNVFDDHRLLNTFCGSPLYASPEIVKGTPYHGPEVDCWSLGVLLYTLVYGAMPFDGSNFKRLTRQISASDYFEPKNPSPASPLIKDMLTRCPSRRADIERICSHWWVNEGYDQNCLEIAEDLAAQTPVRLDLLLSLVPQSASADKLVVGDPRPEPPASSLSTETLVPTRCHSVGSIMELDKSADDRMREMVEGMEEEQEEPKTSGDTKRKLETTPSMEETVAAGVKRKERAKTKKGEERDPRAYKASSRHHSAPIAAAITEEPMEVDLRDPESADAILEMIKEVQSLTPRERSKTPVASEISPAPINEVLEQPKPVVENVTEESVKSPVKTKTASKVEETEEKAKKVTEKEPENAEVQVELTKEGPEAKKDRRLSQKSISVDSDETPAVGPSKPTERRKSKIFETAEKFNQLATSMSTSEPEKPKKIFIPGVNVGGAKKAFERKASLSSIPPPSPTVVKQNPSKVIIDVDKKQQDKVDEKGVSNDGAVAVEKPEEERKREEEKKRAVDIITGALGKPPIKKTVNGSPPLTPSTPDTKKLGLKIQVGPNDVRNATVSVTTPVDTKYPEFEAAPSKPVAIGHSVPTSPEANEMPLPGEPTLSSKMEITLKSATLPRSRKTSKAEIVLSGINKPTETAFKSEVEAKIDAFQPQKLRTQRSEVAFPVAGVINPGNRCSSLEPETRQKPGMKERIIPIQVEPGHQSPPPHAKPPMPQRSMSQRSSSLSRQSTADSDTDSALGSTVGPEPIRKSPREYIIPIAVEGGGYVTPRAGSLEPESQTGTPTSTNPPRSRFGRPRRMGSLLSDASEDESPFSTLHRDSDDLLQRHMHRLRSSRPSKQPPEHADSLSSGEDDDDDGFELLTAENLFSTLLSRVRSLTQRLNVDDNRGTGFPRTRLLDRLGSNSSQGFWGLHEPLSRRMADSPFRRSMSRDTDRFGRKDSAMSSNPGTPNSLGRSTPSRESMFDVGSSHTLPRDKCHELDPETSKKPKDYQDDAEKDKKFTPSLTRRLSRQFIEQTRLSLPRSPSIPRERLHRSSTEEPTSGPSDSLELAYRSKSSDRNLRRATSLLEASSEKTNRKPKRSVSLFDDDDELLPPLPRPQIMTLGRKYRDPVKVSCNGIVTEKIQEEPNDSTNSPRRARYDLSESTENTFSTSDATSAYNSNTNLSPKSDETSPTESTSNMKDDSFNSFKADAKEFENRLLAAENLIKESRMRNLGVNRFDPNLSSSYKDTDKCDKELLGSMSDLTSSILSKRRSCIPSLRLRSGSLTREASLSQDRRNTLTADDGLSLRSVTPERSLLSKLFRSSSTSRESDSKSEKSPKARRRISRFLRPDFFDTPREESQYVKEKEAQKAAENERRKSRFMRRRAEARAESVEVEEKLKNERQEKELKNEVNTLTKEKTNIDLSTDDNKKEDVGVKSERHSPKTSFFQSLEKKLERLRSTEEPKVNGTNEKEEIVKENTIAPAIVAQSPPEILKKVPSAEDVSVSSSAPTSSSTKSKVSSVLGLFKNESKSSVNGNKSQSSTLLSKFKRNTYKGSRSDSVIAGAGDASSTSKIPMKSKLETKNEMKNPKKFLETKRSSDKLTESKKSPPKEKIVKEKTPPVDKSKEKTPTERKPSVEKSLIKSPKKVSPDKSTDSRSDKSEKSIKELRKSGTPDRTDNKLVSNIRLPSPKKVSPEKIIDNKKTELKIPDSNIDKKVIKKKTTKSLTAPLPINGSATKLDKQEDDKKIKKIVVKKEIVEKEEPDGTKKKKIVRVVKKVVKKSPSSVETKTDDKEKPLRSLSLKKIGLRKEKSPESATKKKDTKQQSPNKLNCIGNSLPITPEIVQESKMDTKKEILKDIPEKLSDISKEIPTCSGVNLQLEEESRKPPGNSLVSSEETAKSSVENSKEMLKSLLEDLNDVQAPKIIEEKIKTPPPSPQESEEKLRANRNNLKLDFSKIPQHSFKPPLGPKRESPRLELPKPSTQSKTDDPGPANESPISTTNTSQAFSSATTSSYKASHSGILSPEPKSMTVHLRPKITTDLTEDLLSPMDDGESFDSWSICSNDFNHRCSSDLHSPTSPTYSPSTRSDHPESIIDRIRRKSFYSRFNERKRKSSLTASPSSISSVSPLPGASTLPRKFSFNSSKDIDARKSSYSASPTRRHSERPFTMYNEDSLNSRKSPIDRDRYSDIGSYSNDFEHLRRYRVSPTPEPTRRKYQSSDLHLLDHDIFKSPLTDPITDYRSSRTSSLPRKYTTIGTEPKTAEYYEELLAPTRMDYLTRRTPVPGESGKHENGYTNGHIDNVGDKWRGLSDRIGGVDSPEESDKSAGDDGRESSKSRTETKELSAACPDAEATNSIIE